ncbi:dual specificity protein phosphatase 23 isoform 1-T1 [Morphnus guianensis]
MGKGLLPAQGPRSRPGDTGATRGDRNRHPLAQRWGMCTPASPCAQRGLGQGRNSGGRGRGRGREVQPRGSPVSRCRRGGGGVQSRSPGGRGPVSRRRARPCRWRTVPARPRRRSLQTLPGPRSAAARPPRPPTPGQIQSFLQLVEEANARGEAVAVHCMLGHGRTGTMLACYLAKAQKMNGSDAIWEIRRLRPGSIETREQEQAVIQFCQLVCAGEDSEDA